MLEIEFSLVCSSFTHCKILKKRRIFKLNRLIYIVFFFCLFGVVQTVSAQPKKFSGGEVRAQLISRNVTVLSSELSAKISKMDLHKGDQFIKDTALVNFDCTVERAKLRRSKAKLALDKKTVEINQRLAELQSISLMEVEKSVAEVKKSEADLAVMEAIIDKCVIYAPFSGKIVEVKASQSQYVSAGAQLMEILDDNDLEVELIIPSAWLVYIKPGTKFFIFLDETGEKYDAIISRIGANIDAVSQSIEVMGQIISPHKDLLPGMSGTARFTPTIAR